MAENITGFWVVEEPEKEARKNYPDFPVSPFGPIRLISKETIADLVNTNNDTLHEHRNK